MKIKWGNILLIATLVCLIKLMLKLPGIIEQISYDIRIPDYFDDPVYGLMFLGLVCVTIVVVIRMILDR